MSRLHVHKTAARFRKLMEENGDFATVLFGAGLVVVMRFIASAVGFVSLLLLARWMGSSEYGRYSFAIAWMNLLAYPATLGLPGAAVRFVGQYAAVNDWRRVVGFMQMSAWLAVSCGVLIAILAIGVALSLERDIDTQYVAPTLVALAGIPIVALIIVKAETIRALGWVALAWGPLQIGQPLLLLVIAAVILSVTVRLTATMVVAASIVAYAVSLIGQWGVLRARLGTKIRIEPRVHLGPWLVVARSFLWTSLANLTLLQAGVILVGIFLRPQDVAIYSAATATSGLVTLPLYAAVALGAPKFAALHSQRRQLELQTLVTNIARWTFWPSLVIGLIFVAFGSMVLRLFGPGFQQGYATLLVLILGQLVNAYSGPVVSLLNMTGHQVVAARVLGMSAILAVVVGLVSTPAWGTVGTALSFSTAIVLWNVLLTNVVVRNLEIFPSVSRWSIKAA